VKWHRDIPTDAAIKTVTVKRDGNKWYACFALDLPDTEPPVHPGPAVGIDLGLSALVTLSTGEKVEPPRYYRKAQAKLRRQQRRVSRRKKFSRGWRKAQRLVAKTHAHIANQRKDTAHKLSRQLADTYSLIAVEDLNILGLAKSNLSKSVLDAGWAQLLQFTTYKAESAGSRVVAVDPRGTSQFCSRCGCRVQKNLSVRVHRCSECGLVLDRDENAALNILYRALNAVGPTAGTLTQVVAPSVAPRSPRF
jgi:putative transposase